MIYDGVAADERRSFGGGDADELPARSYGVALAEWCAEAATHAGAARRSRQMDGGEAVTADLRNSYGRYGERTAEEL